MSAGYSVTLIDNSDNSILAIGFQSTLSSALQTLVSNILTNLGWIAIANGASFSSPNDIVDFSFTLSTDICDIGNYSIHAFTANSLTPTVPIANIGTFILTLVEPGNCSTRTCFTLDELEDLYQQVLNMCKLCNCT